MDRIIREDGIITVSQDKTRYKNSDVVVLKKWYPHEYKTMELLDISDEEGYINYKFSADNFDSFHIKRYTTLEKLRCAYSLFSYEVLSRDGYFVSFENDNLYLDKSKCIEVLFIEDLNVYSNKVERSDFYNQIKARILSMFSKYSFDEVIKSNFTLSFSSKFENEILNTTSTNELKLIIIKYIELEEKEQEEKYVFVKRKGFVLYRAFTLVFLLLFLFVSGFSIYNYLTNTKTLELENKLYTDFVDEKYSEVLKNSKGEKLGLDQKYIVGYSGIMTSSLDNDKKQIILSTYSKNISEATMEYWANIGYGDYEKAIDKAKTINNDEYVLYALRLEENRLLNDNTIEGAKKEEMLKSVQDQIKTYEEKLGLSKEESSNE